MQRHWRIVTLTLILVLGATASLTVRSTPTSQSRPHMTDEMRCLADIKQLQLQVIPLRPGTTQAGLDEPGIKNRAKELLTDAGFEVVDQSITPRLVITVDIGERLIEGGSYSYVVFIDVVQKVHVERLNLNLVLPTATIPAHGATKSKNLKHALMDRVAESIKMFIAMEKRASANK